MLHDLVRFSYKSLPDSTLNTIDRITESFPAFADSMSLLLSFYRNESMIKKNESHDVINNINAIRESRVKGLSDSLLYIRIMLQAMDAYSMQRRHFEMDSIYTYIIEKYIAGNGNLLSRVNYVNRHYLSKLEEHGRWRDALDINVLLDDGNREKAARNMYLKARMYEQAGMQDSAVYFYRVTEQGHLPLLASLASSIDNRNLLKSGNGFCAFIACSA